METFVANRVADIKTRIPGAQWCHVYTHENPADCALRGLLGNELPFFSLWWQEPPWLHVDKTAWLAQNHSQDINVNEEARQSVAHFTQSEESWDLAIRFSS